MRWLFAIFLLVRHPLPAEPPRFVVRVWQSEAGLPGNAVRSVAQAADGYLWVATAEGVVRFDGVRFSGFDTAAESALAAAPARALFPHGNGDVWVGLDRGGLLRWRAGRLERVLPESAAPGMGVTQVIATAGAAVAVRGGEWWRVESSGAARPIEREAALTAALETDAAAWLDRGRVPAASALPQLLDRAGRRWAVGAAGGLTVTEPDGRSTNVPLPVAAPAYRISELSEDRDGNIWAATADNGLAQIRPARVGVLGVEEGLSDRVVLAVLEARDGAMWLAGKGGEVDRISPEGVQHFPIGDGSRPVVALLEDGTGAIWAASRYGSVFRLEAGVFRALFPAPSVLAQAHAMAADRDGRIWFGCNRGLVVLEGGEPRLVPLGGEVEEITALAVEAAGAVWVGTRSGRVWRGGQGGFSPHPAAPGRLISALSPAAGGGMWAATLGAGLWHLHGEKATPISTPQGLPDARLTAVLEESSGHVWLGSLAGIFRVPSADLAALAAGRSAAPRWLRLDRADGLPVRECSGHGQPSAWRGRDGRLWFPTVNGVVTIQPGNFVANEVPPITRIEALIVNGETRPARGGVITAGPGHAWFDARFTAFSFAAPEKLRFFHRLEGLESNWRETRERTVSYAAVPPGRYVFRVRAEDGDGVLDAAGAAQEVWVHPHFWQTVWFRTAALIAGALLAAGAGLAVARARWRRRMAHLEIQHAREAERARIARDLHDDLGASLTEISLLAHVTAEEDAAAPVRASLEEIATKAQTVVGALDEIVWAVNPRHDTLASLADYVAAFAGEFLAAAGLALRLEMPREYPPVAVEAEHRHALLLAVRETLNNVVKHAAATAVRLRLSLPSGAVEVEIADNGRGFTPDAAPAGEGLRNLRHRLAALGGNCQIASTAGGGTRVALRLPLHG